MERRRVSTRKPILNIDPSIRDQAIMQTLMPDFTTPYIRVTKSDLNEIRELSQLTLAGKMSLSAQVRVLLNQMDPKRRVLPVLAGSAELTTSLKHALTHTNFVITGYITEEMREQPIVNRILESFGKNLHYEYVITHLTTEAIREIMANTMCLEKPLTNYLMNPDLPETNYIKWMKVVIGRYITSESENHGLKTSPVPSRITIKFVENVSGVRFIIYEGQEVVNFKYGDIRGSFVHSGESILKITTNYTSFQELIEGITEIAIYCRWGMRGTTSYSYDAMKNEVRNLIHMKPHLPLNCLPQDMNALLSMNSPVGIAGALNIVESSEYKPCEFMSPYIDNNGNISSKTTRQAIHFPIPRDLPKPIPDEIRCSDRRMINHLSFKRLLKSKVSFYLEYNKELRRKVRSGVFDWENKVFVRYTKQNRILSKTCRDLLTSIVEEEWDPGVAAFYYYYVKTDVKEEKILVIIKFENTN